MSQSVDNVVLIGMPGVGKSTLGVVLAKIINKQFVDADLVIQNKYGKTLQTLINERGVEGFIALENETLGEIEVANAIVATGGSAVYSDKAMDHLREIGTVMYLEIPYESLVERLGDLDERGVVMRGDGMTLRDLFDERKPLYEKHADLTVDVDGLSITDAARKVAAALGLWQ